MKQEPYIKNVEIITKEDFHKLYLSHEPEDLFSKRELQVFSFPKDARSLAGRYLIKKAIFGYLKSPGKMNNIDILNDESGKPLVLIGKELKKEVEGAGIRKILCSISHSRNFIAGMTIICF
jgi:phosphopantetheinyl transferase (holo-ACP synthase)